MSEALAQWIDRFADAPPPVLRARREACLALSGNPDRPLSHLVRELCVDPGLSIAAVGFVNRQRSARHDPVAAVGKALGLLGMSKVREVIEAVPVLEERVADPGHQRRYRRLLLRAYHSACQSRDWAERIRDPLPNEAYLAGLSRYAGELMVCAHEPERLLELRRLMWKHGLPDAAAARAVLGFTLEELTEALGRRWGLGEASLLGVTPLGTGLRRAILIKLAGETARQAERGWYTPAMTACMEAAADTIGQAPSLVVAGMQATALDMARILDFADARPGAVNLLLPPDHPPPIDEDERPPPPPPRVAEPTGRERIAAAENPAAALQALIRALGSDCRLGRAGFCLLDKDKQRLVTRFGLGLERGGAAAGLNVELAKSALLAQVLKRPAALWIAPDSYSKYSKGLSRAMIDALQTRDIFLMSLFVADKPIGLVWADNGGSALDEKRYRCFKGLVLSASKTLEALHRSAAGRGLADGRAP